MRRLTRACAGVVVALAVLAAPASAALTSITSSPLSVYADGLGGIQIVPAGQTAGVFYNPFSVNLDAAPHAGLEAVVNGTAFQLGVNRVATVPTQVTTFSQGARALTSEYDLQVTGAPPTLHVKELLTYVDGSPAVGVQYDITNVSGAAATVRVGVLADIYSEISDVGTSSLETLEGTRMLAATSPATGMRVGLVEVDPVWSAYQAGLYSSVFANFTGAGLDNGVDATAVDNALGTQWDLGTLDPGGTAIVTTGWIVQPGQGGLAPDLGRSVVASTRKGIVRVKLPGSKRFVDLKSLRELPVGTTFDTTRGQVTLTSAANAKGATQKGWFYKGLFKIGQSRGPKPLTTLTMSGPAPACGKAGRARSSKKVRSRRLWGDGEGRFQTKGKFSSATVRGTKWLVEDRCDGTLTRVTRGSVTVRDFAKRKAVVVKAGQSYLARKPG